MFKNVGEVVADIRVAETDEDKVKILSETRIRVALADVIKAALKIDPFVEALNDGVEYKPSTVPYPHNDLRLVTAYRLFGLFRNTRLDPERVKVKFIQVLESLHAEEAAILIDAAKGTLDIGYPLEDALDALGYPVDKEEKPAEKPEEAPEPAKEPEVVKEKETVVEDTIQEETPKPEVKPRRTRKSKS